MQDARSQIIQDIQARSSELIQLSLKIHQHPELAFEEFQASACLADYLESHGFILDRGWAGLPTAFRGRYGAGQPTVAFLAEYDALPQIGHGCGHNIIGVAAMAAGVAARHAADRWGGTIMVLGTPAEELYGGKALIIDKVGLDGVDVALMIHPGSRNMALARSLACVGLEVEFFGRATHASARPDEGINALEAMVQAFNHINSLRQHVRSGARIHGIITDGGQAVNVVPAHSAASFLIRAEDQAYLDKLKERVLNCFLAASMATGARLEHRWGRVTYAPFRPNQALARAFAQNLQALGREVEPLDRRWGLGSTDMGNVSQVVPSLHASVAIAGSQVASHSLEFAAAAASEAGHRGLLDGATALALTAADLLAQPDLLQEVKEEFCQPEREGRAGRGVSP